MGTDEKRTEIDVYDGENEADARPAYDAHWAADHQERLLEVGPGGAFERLLERYATEGDVLVIGCGTGENVRRLAERDGARRVTGIEVSADRLAAARSRCAGTDVDLCRADAERLPFADGVFDAVIAHSVLHHLPDWRGQGLDTLTRVLDDEGALLFYEPGLYNPPAALRRRLFPSRIHTPGETPFDPVELRSVLEQRFGEVSLRGHCIVSNVIPVVANYFPFELPVSVTEGAYRLERAITRGPLERMAWIFTGAARLPSR